MLGETDKYRLSIYQAEETIKSTPQCLIEKAFCTLDEQLYIKRTYPDDKREVYVVLKDLHSDHIPRITDIFFEDSTIIIEEYVQGTRLSDLIESGKINHKQAERFALQLLVTLDVLHSHNIIHRDVKPDNILIGEDGMLWLIDYGIARLYRKNSDRDTQMLGTIGYAPPEQFGFAQSDFRTDLYSAGVTIEEMCKAADCTNLSAVMKIAVKCRELDPSRRYHSANAALRDISSRQWRSKIILAAALLAVAAIVYINMGQATERIPADTRNPDFEIGQQSDILWYNIIENYSDESVLYIPISTDTALEDEAEISLADGRPEIEMLYQLKNGVLDLTLNDHVLPEQHFTFSYTGKSEPDYRDTSVEAEILFFDMDEDGQDELLITLSDRRRITGVKGVLLCNTNWSAVWCVGYTQSEGFWQAEGTMIANDGSVALDFLGEHELYHNHSNSNEWLRLIDRKLVPGGG